MKAASYSRRSDSKGKRNDERSVHEQDELNLRAAHDNGWDLPPTRMYCDNDLSASRYTTKQRPDWQKLEALLGANEIDVLIIWETSRAWRKLSEWILLVDACRDSQVLMHVTSHHRTYDPTQRRDRKTLIEEGVDSEDETEKTSERVKRTMDANKAAGKPHSRPPYGYQIQIDPSDPRKTIRAIVPEQAAIVKEVIRRVASSEPVSAVERDLIQRAVPSPSVAQGLTPHPRSKGTPLWSKAMIRRLCTNEAYVGKRGSVDATWEPIMRTEEEVNLFYAANSLIKDPKRKTTKPGSAKHFLSFVATCEVCGSFLTRMGGTGKPDRYKCSASTSCVTIRMDWLDELISGLVCARLAKPDVFSQITTRESKEKLHTELARLNAEHQEALALRRGGKLSLRALSQEEDRLLPLIQDIENKLQPTPLPQAVRDLRKDAVGNLELIQARWNKLEIPARKDVVRTLLTSIKIRKSPTKGKLTKLEQIQEVLRQRVQVEWE